VSLTGRESNSYVQSFGDWQNSKATPYLPECKSGCVGRLRPDEQVLKTLPKPEILPPNSSRPAVGGIVNSTFKRLPGSKTSSAVSKYKPPGLTFTVQPLWSFSAVEPTFRHDKPSVIGNRLNFRFSELFITCLPAQFPTSHTLRRTGSITFCG
jgi:hypothetical protein